MDYRILATAEADSIRDKAEWEVELDRVTLLQRVLSVGETCFNLAVMWGFWKAIMIVISAINPRLSLEDASFYIQLFFALVIIIYTLIKMENWDTFIRAADKLDFFLVVQTPNWIRWCCSKIYWLLNWLPWLGHTMFKLAKPRPGADHDHQQDEDLRDQDQFWASNTELPRSPTNLSYPAEDVSSNEEPGYAELGDYTHEQVPLSPRPPPFHANNDRLAFVGLRWILKAGVTVLVILLILVAWVGALGLASTWPITQLIGLVAWIRFNVRPNSESDCHNAQSQPDARPAQSCSPRPSKSVSLILTAVSNSRRTTPQRHRPGLVSVTASARQGTLAQPSPATLWAFQNPRLLAYRAELESIRAVINDWDSLSYAQKPRQLREYRERLSQLQIDIASDRALELVKDQWGSVPMLDEICHTISWQLSWFANVSFDNKDAEKIVPAHAHSEMSESRRKRIRLIDTKNQDERRTFQREQVAAWTKDKMDMRDVVMTDVSIPSAASEIEDIASRLETFMRETTRLLRVFKGASDPPVTLDSLHKLVDEGSPIHDLIFTRSELEDADKATALASRISNATVLDSVVSLVGSTNVLLQDAYRLRDDHVLAADMWRMNVVIRKAQAMINSLNEFLKRALKGYVEDLTISQEDLFLCSQPSSMQDVYDRTLKFQTDVKQLRRNPALNESTQEIVDELLQRLPGFIKSLKVTATMLSHQSEFQVSGKPEAIRSLATALLDGLRPTATSGENYLCGPRALIKSLQGVGALSRRVDADDILARMYTDYFIRRARNERLELGARSDLSPAYYAYLQDVSGGDSSLFILIMDQAKTMNNFSGEQLQWMLGFMMRENIVEDKYQLGFVIEECAGGPWVGFVQEPCSGVGVSARETVWLYCDNAEGISEAQVQWIDYAKKYRNDPSNWGDLCNQVDYNIGQAPVVQISHWSGFSTGFGSLGKDELFGLVKDLSRDVVVRNEKKKGIKKLMTDIVSSWTRNEISLSVQSPGGDSLFDFDQDAVDSFEESGQSNVSRNVVEITAAPCLQGSQRRVCKYFQKGSCKHGARCMYTHEKTWQVGSGDGIEFTIQSSGSLPNDEEMFDATDNVPKRHGKATTTANNTRQALKKVKTKAPEKKTTSKNGSKSSGQTQGKATAKGRQQTQQASTEKPTKAAKRPTRQAQQKTKDQKGCGNKWIAARNNSAQPEGKLKQKSVRKQE